MDLKFGTVQLKPFILALVVVVAVYSRDLGYIIFGALIVFFFLSW